MTTRILPRDEWAARLAGTNLGSVSLPAQSIVYVVEDGDSLAGCWAVIPVWHAEGIEIMPPYRQRGVVLRRLLRGLAHVGAYLGITSVWTQADTDDVAKLIEKNHGSQIRGRVYSMPVKGF